MNEEEGNPHPIIILIGVPIVIILLLLVPFTPGLLYYVIWNFALVSLLGITKAPLMEQINAVIENKLKNIKI